MLFKNPNEGNDFVTGHTICDGDVLPWSQRLTSSYGLVVTLAGHGCISLDGEAIQVEQGDVLLLKPHRKHLFRPLDKWDLLWFHFLPRPHMTPLLEWPENIPGASQVRFPPEEFVPVRASLEEAHGLEYQRSAGWNPLAFLLLEAVVARGYNHRVTCAEETHGSIRLAQQLLTESSDDIDTIALRCRMSRASLYTKFKQLLGVSPRQYREYAILRRAIPLLECLDLSIAEIAERIGMPDPYYFSTRFHKFSGMSPREYRRKAMKDAADLPESAS